MKTIILALALITSTAHASERASCYSNVTSQSGSTLKSDAKLNFKIAINNGQATITDLTGYIDVQGAFEEPNTPMTADNSYRGQFKFARINSNPNYRAHKYKGYAQFADFNAVTTSGLEDGMWGEFVIDVSANPMAHKISAKYIFKAGDHMGGTVHFTCLMGDRFSI